MTDSQTPPPNEADALFEEIGALMGALEAHAQCGQRYASLRSPNMLGITLAHIRRAYLAALTLSREAAHADRHQI
jgi:hypothetical protein